MYWLHPLYSDMEYQAMLKHEAAYCHRGKGGFRAAMSQTSPLLMHAMSCEVLHIVVPFELQTEGPTERHK